MIQALGIPGGYGSRDYFEKNKPFISGQESLNLLAGQQALGDRTTESGYRQGVREELANELTQPLSLDPQEQMQLESTVDQFIKNKGISPEMRGKILNDFTNARMQKKQEMQRGQFLQSQVDPEKFLFDKGPQGRSGRVSVYEMKQKARMGVDASMGELTSIAQEANRRISENPEADLADLKARATEAQNEIWQATGKTHQASNLMIY